ncbi:sensor histidine kinase [Desulfomonile tiedjei]|uniref:histidine kinase n=1 Tax=Desulfomonile tiedjei (strain ATCC 49306 / DSM 6799 / DCB-1) TaxID=706587 RepID=I4CDR0_DESTA|nr:ATP-binding protein [Desulfomonile tiedjei]AFM27701.1 PAS domain S-box [Desulfomonile tiedjei DSM 6799]
MAEKSINILLVEDEEAHAEALRRAFRKAEGPPVNLTCVSNIEDALTYLSESFPDLVISDWLLPDGKGTDILPAGEEDRSFPIILMTSHGDERLAVDAMKAGAADYVVKSPLAFADMPYLALRVLQQWELVAEHKRNQEKLRESEERFRTVFEQGPLGMHIADLNYRFVTCNKAYSQIVGYSEEELRKLTFTDISFPEDIAEDIEKAKKLYRGEIPYYKMEKRLVRKQGEIVWIGFTRSIVRDSEGKPLYFLSMIEDISERKRTEELLRRGVEELARSNEDLRQFAYVASHDLQEPLRNVANCLQLLEQRHKGKLGGDSDQLIDWAVAGAKKMRSLIIDLLTFSRISTKGNSLEETDSEEVAKEALVNLRYVIDEHGACITHDPLPIVNADPVQLMQVFQNLIGNAIKFRRDEPPKIHISAERNGSGDWVFSVKDNGIGIPERHHDRIFVIFQRLQKKGPFKGTGMGLAIVKKIIERHKGRVWVESEVGVGSTFYFTMPDSDARSAE